MNNALRLALLRDALLCVEIPEQNVDNRRVPSRVAGALVGALNNNSPDCQAVVGEVTFTPSQLLRSSSRTLSLRSPSSLDQGSWSMRGTSGHVANLVGYEVGECPHAENLPLLLDGGLQDLQQVQLT